jgi:uncharacterized membrane protein YeaQ/YmgE (transglycosylase-associated protein family)
MSKGLIYLAILIGGAIGSYIPVLFHQGTFSAASLIGGTIGSLVGIWVVVKFNNYI